MKQILEYTRVWNIWQFTSYMGEFIPFTNRGLFNDVFVVCAEPRLTD